MEPIITSTRASEFTHPIAVKPSNTDKIDHLIAELQTLWGDYQESPNCQLENRIRQLTGDLKQELQKTQTIAYSLTPAVKKQIEEQTNYTSACEAQLREIHHEPSKPLAKTLSPAELLEADGWKLVNVKGDGNCGLRAIVKQVYPNANEDAMIKTLRQQMVREMRSSLLKEVENQIKDGMVATLTDTTLDLETQRQTVNVYCDRMARDGSWLGERELQTISQILKRPLWVYNPDCLRCNEHGKLEPWDLHKHNATASDEPIRVFYSGNHYQALV